MHPKIMCKPLKHMSIFGEVGQVFDYHDRCHEDGAVVLFKMAEFMSYMARGSARLCRRSIIPTALPYDSSKRSPIVHWLKVELPRHVAMQHIKHRGRPELKYSVEVESIAGLLGEFQFIATDDER
jgi:hypothetical protein